MSAIEGNMAVRVKEYMDAHVSTYAESHQANWLAHGEWVRKGFIRWDTEEVDPGAIDDFLRQNWGAKPRMMQAIHGWLSKFFRWAVLRRYAIINPCREVQAAKPKRRRVYITNRHFLAIREGLAICHYTKTIKDTKRSITAVVPTGKMMQIFIDLCYLTCQRSTEIRSLQWSQIDEYEGVIHFFPSKTKGSSGMTVDWPITPPIAAVLERARSALPKSNYVIRNPKGKPKTAAACRDAWRDAKLRAGLGNTPYTIKDIRAKAMTDANKQGYTLDELQVAGAHADRSTTADYIKRRDTPVSRVLLDLPDDKDAGF